MNNLIFNQLKNRKMNKVIMGLSCLGVLSAVSCDNDKTTTKTTPLVEKVNFSAATGEADITIGARDKVKLVVKKGEKFAKYYTDSDRSTGKEFTADGKEFTLKADGGVNGGFFLEANEEGIAYKITKFDLITKAGKKYELKDHEVAFTLVKGTAAKPKVTVVEKKDGSIKGSSEEKAPVGKQAPAERKGEGTSFNVSKSAFNQGTFNLKLKKSDGTLFNSTDDSAVTIMLDLQDGTASVSPLFPVANLFATQGLAQGSTKFDITVSREFDHYTNLGDLIATAKNSTEEAAVAHPFSKDTESGSAKDGGNVVLKITNTNPIIKDYGIDGASDYVGEGTGANNKFNLSGITDKDIKIFSVSDNEKDKVKTVVAWTLTYDGRELDNSAIAIMNLKGQTDNKKLSEYTKSTKINPFGLGISKDSKIEYLKDKETKELDKYVLKGVATSNDGLGGKAEVNVKFHFTKTSTE